jgi:hypothetical protein
VSQSINGSFAIRDGQWKLLLCPGSGGWSFPKPGADDTTGMPEFQLYDLASDPGEKTNLVADHPDRVTKMKAMIGADADPGLPSSGGRGAVSSRAMFCSWRIRSRVTPNSWPTSSRVRGLLSSEAETGVDDLALALVENLEQVVELACACSCG